MFDASHGHLLTFLLYLNFEKFLQSKFLTFPVILKFEMNKNIMYLGCHIPIRVHIQITSNYYIAVQSFIGFIRSRHRTSR